MRKNLRLGLLAAGPVSPALFRVANLHVHLGPVAAASLRVASRLANRLKAGTAVQPEELGQAELIFISGPECDFPELLRLAISSGIDWQGRTAILLDFRRDAVDLGPLRDQGASTGTLDSLDAFPDRHFIADVDKHARRRLQRFALATSSSIFYLDPGRKHVCAAGMAFTGMLFVPLVAATVKCLKKAGLTAAEAILIAEHNTLHTLRSWHKSGRKGWYGAVPDGDVNAVRRQLKALNDENEVLSEYFETTARLALLLFGEDPAWLNALVAESSANLEANVDLQTPRLAADSPRRLLGWLREEPGQTASIDLNEVIRAALPLVQLALGRGVRCTTNLSAMPLILLLDQPLFLNALLNLAGSASAAMGGRGTFTILTNRDNSTIRLSLEDTRAGMDDAACQRAFTPGGTNLGLEMETVQLLAESHRASVAIDTAPGQGCRFTLGFPYAVRTAAK